VPEVVQNELRANTHQKDYLPVLGLRQLRGAVSGYMRRVHGVSYPPENIMIGPGSKELMFILQLAYYSDLVIPNPSWVSYAPQAHIIGRHIYWLNTIAENDWKVTPDEISRLCHADPDRPRLIIFNYPANPHGCSYTEKELKGIAKVAQKYRIILLSDEIYGEVNHTGNHVSIARFYPEGTIISTGISKWCGAGGWRLGVFAFPKTLYQLKEAMAVIASETFTSTSAPIQYAAVRAFKGGAVLEKYLAHTRRILRGLAKLLYRELVDANVTVAFPDGAFYLFPDFGFYREKLTTKNVSTSEALSEVLLKETGVAALPGSEFGRPPEELTLRLSYVDFDGARALIASYQIPLDEELDNSFFYQYAINCCNAIDQMVQWLNAL
jgi:aspartate aminotransferase